MVLLGTVATVIASQAVITGAFSLASRPVQLGYLPRLRVVHTSASTYGQVYMPWINGMLMVAVPILVFAFRSSAALAYAYGMAVTGTITITTMLYLYIARTRWRAPLWLIVIGGGALLGSRRNHPRDRTFRVMEAPDIPRALCVLEPTKTEGLIAIDAASYFLSKIKLTKGGHPFRHGVRSSSSPRSG